MRIMTEHKGPSLHTATQALHEFRRLVQLKASELQLNNVFAELSRNAPEELPHFRELLQEDIVNMNDWLDKNTRKRLREKIN